MMLIEASDSMHALIFAIAVLLTVAVIALVRIEGHLRHGIDFWNSPTGASLQNMQDETQAIQSADTSSMLEQRCAALEKSMENLSARQKELPAVSHSEKSYDSAVRLAKTGADAEQITKNFGISKGEAQLLVRLHAAQAAALSSSRLQ